MAARASNSGVRLAELIAALSLATDLGMGQPLETALSSCIVAMRLGEALRLDVPMRRDVYYHALLRYIGQYFLQGPLNSAALVVGRDYDAVEHSQLSW